jgi:hypothetical protein
MRRALGTRAHPTIAAQIVAPTEEEDPSEKRWLAIITISTSLNQNS